MKFRHSMVLVPLVSCCLAASAAFPTAASSSPSKKPQTQPATSPSKPKSAPPQTAPAPPPSEQTQGGITVRENYYLELPGIDLSALTPKQKEKFLERVNKEFCTCNCPNDTIAHCLVNDPKCPVVRGMAEKVLSEVKAGD